MLDRLLESPMLPIGFIAFVLLMAGVYFVNRERAQIERLRGPRRFQPAWSRKDGRRRRRRRRRTGGQFNPGWSRSEPAGPPESEDQGRDGVSSEPDDA